MWYRRYISDWSPAVDAIAAAHRRPDLYLLTDINTPFEQDGTRDGEHIREWMHQTIAEELAAHARPYVALDWLAFRTPGRSLIAVQQIMSGSGTG